MRNAALPALLLAAGCASAPVPYAPVRDVQYAALGAEPFWLLTIGDDRIVLRTAERQVDAVWPRTLPRTEDGVHIWRSGEGDGGIVVEARPGPCAARDGRTYEDNVIVRQGGRALGGCGGRLARRERR